VGGGGQFRSAWNSAKAMPKVEARFANFFFTGSGRRAS